VTGQKRRITYWVSRILTARSSSLKESFDKAHWTRIGPKILDRMVAATGEPLASDVHQSLKFRSARRPSTI
jgi:hypothetical protein